MSNGNMNCVTCEKPLIAVEQAGRSLSQVRWLTCDYCKKSCHLRCLVSTCCLPTTSDKDKQKMEQEFSRDLYICQHCRQESANGTGQPGQREMTPRF